ncbi:MULTISPECIES: polyprenyl diphosphate synthase [unclassified Dehalobacter]|uniref:polyprenyl diphosphate synthase n=1 Tax=unclassified Dehalobacter TaxID=2635733 RepID=UPI000381A4C8|nr:MULTISPECIES: polyprenyl diphosphate synthase [unclassified Dehalobacter]RJE48226.1 di-trans,poly-cis-decaprenylcistransferase [Dehalobacter sp. MCB1]TCX49705.1 di-trans,poly-cis-decaprenylcistransferase [Dehalobacter sp. 14DCB1]TCX50172.1 di-trans,poly-cis-decaprenylcistransferase [Dehalobacter sp. 12DCB1]
MRIPNHIGVIPDGNRRWADNNGLPKEMGYREGLNPGLKLLKLCREAGVKELTYYGFTVDNTKRPATQKKAFVQACIDAIDMIASEDVSLLVIGDTESKMFPKALLPYTRRTKVGNGGIRVNFLVNYGWEWDLGNLRTAEKNKRKIIKELKSNDISRVDLLIRWGGRRRLSGFLPAQSVYADFYVLDDYWPDFKEAHFYDALKWYNTQDITLGG